MIVIGAENKLTNVLPSNVPALICDLGHNIPNCKNHKKNLCNFSWKCEHMRIYIDDIPLFLNPPMVNPISGCYQAYLVPNYEQKWNLYVFVRYNFWPMKAKKCWWLSRSVNCRRTKPKSNKGRFKWSPLWYLACTKFLWPSVYSSSVRKVTRNKLLSFIYFFLKNTNLVSDVQNMVRAFVFVQHSRKQKILVN